MEENPLKSFVEDGKGLRFCVVSFKNDFSLFLIDFVKKTKTKQIYFTNITVICLLFFFKPQTQQFFSYQL